MDVHTSINTKGDDMNVAINLRVFVVGPQGSQVVTARTLAAT